MLLKKKNFFYILNCQILFVSFVLLYNNLSKIILSFPGYENDFTLLKFIFSNIAFIILVSFSNKLNRPSDFFNQILIFFFTLPVFVYFIYNNESFIVPLVVFIFVLSCLFFNKLFRVIFKTLIQKIPTYRMSFFFKLLILLILIYLFFYLIFSLEKFNELTIFQDAKRGEFGSILYNNIFHSYAINLLVKVFLPIFLLMAIIKKNYFFLLLCFCFFVFVAIVTAHKSYLFYFFLIIFSIYACKYNNKHIVIFLIMFTILLSYFAYNFYDNNFVSSLLFRRAYLSSAQAIFMYYNFFSVNDFIFWSNSIMSSFIHYPYELAYNKIVYNFFFNKNSGNNSSFITMGYMHAGFLGIGLYFFIYKLLIGYLDALQEKFDIPTWCIVAINLVPFYILINFSDLTVALLTHGLLSSLILTYLLIPIIKKILRKN